MTTRASKQRQMQFELGGFRPNYLPLAQVSHRVDHLQSMTQLSKN